MYQGPPESATVWPVGAVVSGVKVMVVVAVRPALLVAVMFWLPEGAVGLVV